jgi:non-ribosomal peptide synthetase component F
MAMPLFVTLLSAYVVLLHRYSGQTSIIVGVPFTNRRRSDFRDVMGCFVNILPIHVDLSGDPSFRDVAQAVRKTMLAAHRCQEVTVELIVERLKLERDLRYNPLYQVGMTYSPPIDFQLQGVTVMPLNAHPSSSQLDMFTSLWESEAEIRGRVEFCTDLFERSTMERFVDHYEMLLKAVVKDADCPIGTRPILSEVDRIGLLSEQDISKMPGRAEPDVHVSSEMQAQQALDRSA